MRILYPGLALVVLPLALSGCHGTQSTNADTSGGANHAPAPATLSNPAISPALASMARKVRAADSASAAAALSSRTIHVNDRREIQVYVHVKTLSPELQQNLSQAGADEVRASKPLGLYQAWVGAAALARIAQLDGVTKITPPSYAFTRSTH
jgi:hypothetical protein